MELEEKEKSLLELGESYSWIRYIKQRISKNKNFLALLSGPTGSGKSWSALAIGEMLDPEFDETRVIFKGSELMELINSGTLKSGSVIVWDEAGIDLSSKNWQSMTNKLLNFLFQTFRHRNLILIFTTPYNTFVDKSTRKLFHAEIRTQKINLITRKVVTRPVNLQYNSRMDKTYTKRLIKKDNYLGHVAITTWDIPSPSKSLIEKYELKKDEFTSALNDKIQSELGKLEEKNSEFVTPEQQQILDAWKVGIFSNTKIAEMHGRTQPGVCKMKKNLLKKPKFQKLYHEYWHNNLNNKNPEIQNLST